MLKMMKKIKNARNLINTKNKPHNLLFYRFQQFCGRLQHIEIYYPIFIYL